MVILGSLTWERVMEAIKFQTSRKPLKPQSFQCAAWSLFPSAGPSPDSWEDGTCNHMHHRFPEVHALPCRALQSLQHG